MMNRLATMPPDYSKEPYCSHCGTPKSLRNKWSCASLKQHQFPKEKS